MLRGILPWLPQNMSKEGYEHRPHSKIEVTSCIEASHTGIDQRKSSRSSFPSNSVRLRNPFFEEDALQISEALEM